MARRTARSGRDRSRTCGRCPSREDPGSPSSVDFCRRRRATGRTSYRSESLSSWAPARLRNLGASDFDHRLKCKNADSKHCEKKQRFPTLRRQNAVVNLKHEQRAVQHRKVDEQAEQTDAREGPSRAINRTAEQACSCIFHAFAPCVPLSYTGPAYTEGAASSAAPASLVMVGGRRISRQPRNSQTSSPRRNRSWPSLPSCWP